MLIISIVCEVRYFLLFINTFVEGLAQVLDLPHQEDRQFTLNTKLKHYFIIAILQLSLLFLLYVNIYIHFSIAILFPRSISDSFTFSKYFSVNRDLLWLIEVGQFEERSCHWRRTCQPFRLPTQLAQLIFNLNSLCSKSIPVMYDVFIYVTKDWWIHILSLLLAQLHYSFTDNNNGTPCIKNLSTNGNVILTFFRNYF